MIETLHSVFPLKIFLCTQNKVLAFTELSINEFFEDNIFPLIKTTWIDFTSMCEHVILDNNLKSSIKVGVNISKTNDNPTKTIDTNVNEVEIDENSSYSEGDFEEDDDDTPPPPAPNDDHKNSHKDTKEVHFKDDDDDDDNKSSNMLTNPSNNPDDTGAEEEEDDESNEEKQQQLRHFRLSVEVKSIGGFKRPAHLAIQFSYPHLGAGVPVRTHPLWVC
jgi:hypothetical protein